MNAGLVDIFSRLKDQIDDNVNVVYAHYPVI